jgi:hypothetical protein
MGDHDGVDVVDFETRPGETIDEMSPRVITRETRVDDCDASLVFEHVAVHVPEAGHADRELSAHDAGCHLGDIGGCVLLLLLRRALGWRLVGTGYCVIVLVGMLVLLLHCRAGLRRLRDLVVIGTIIVPDPTTRRRTRARRARRRTPVIPVTQCG